MKPGSGSFFPVASRVVVPPGIEKANPTPRRPRDVCGVSQGPVLAPPPRGPHPRCPRGFTLLEVLAAIALLALAFAVGLGALGAAARNAARGAALDTAVERAQTLLSEQGLAKPLVGTSQSGRFDDGMTWTLEVRALPRQATASGSGAPAGLQQDEGALMAQASGVDLYRLDVAVQYGAGRTLRLSTLRAQASASPPP